MSVRTSVRWLLGVLALALALTMLSGIASAGPRGGVRGGCDNGYSAYRDPANPLALPQDPGPDPLRGARFFVAGPRDGVAARAIVRALGLNPSRYPHSYSWARFERALSQGRLAKRIRRRRVGARVHLLEKIASQPVGQMISRYSAGGGPGAIYSTTQDFLCLQTRSDPGSIPIINTYFLYQAGYCESTRTILAHRPTFERQVSEMARAIGRRPVVLLLEMDAIGSSTCMARSGSLPAWEGDLRYEIDTVAALPHTVVYVEGGYSDAARPAYTARVLRAVDVGRIQGFYTNDTHINWAINEIHWAEKVSGLAGGAHFVVNTSDSGRGPLLNADPARQGVEDLCNPPGRGAGPRPSTDTGFPNLDAFLWVHVPGLSSGSCNGGTPSGTFWLARTLAEAANANGQLGPGFPSLPY